MDAFTRQLDEMESLMKRAKQYVADVRAGTQKGNAGVGRALMRALTNESQVDAAKLEELVSGSVKDTLMVTYLSTMCRTQIVLAEKIQHILASQQGENN